MGIANAGGNGPNRERKKFFANPLGKVAIHLSGGESVAGAAKHPIVGVKIPEYGGISELGGDAANAVVIITLRRAEVLGRDAAHLLDDGLSPLELNNDLLVRQRGQNVMGPGMDGDLVATIRKKASVYFHWLMTCWIECRLFHSVDLRGR
ncbi:hypothetical protein BC938DRAFT_481538 [Jimgerdemannia flammicorona]|uniref:Uncharacterized protein n=1 Tax=Jimgerdemannia flammicorona TaxID=994334 RepID=A0A433QFZ0_9FUNG|nr:hypothetical protein BC938DRAFT_481538 [Jimgerdemannia flammicorona]